MGRSIGERQRKKERKKERKERKKERKETYYQDGHGVVQAGLYHYMALSSYITPAGNVP